MRKELYKALVERLKQLIVLENEITFVSTERLQAMKDAGETPEEAIKYFALWNRQVEFIQVEQPFAMPAVFVELGKTKWRHQSGGLQDADLVIGLHVLTKFIAEGYENDLFYLDLLDNINACLHGFSSDRFSSMQRMESIPCHDHEEILDSTEVFTCLALDDSAVKETVKITVAPNLSVKIE
ncbi:hypothetical protein EZS27_004508 [termite gut metagenome]|uniref:Uncharacterized protein n=1 Tax=termite gut metagenome TaxID=433724 RepID=A0A5J4SPP8_9ZZZZ